MNLCPNLSPGSSVSTLSMASAHCCKTYWIIQCTKIVWDDQRASGRKKKVNRKSIFFSVSRKLSWNSQLAKVWRKSKQIFWIFFSGTSFPLSNKNNRVKSPITGLVQLYKKSVNSLLGAILHRNAIVTRDRTVISYLFAISCLVKWPFFDSHPNDQDKRLEG